MGKPILKINILLLLVLVVSFHHPSYAQQMITLSDSIDEYKIGKYTEILFDPSKKLTINDVAFGNASNDFKPLNSDHTNLGYREETIWLRFELKIDSIEAKDWLLNLDYQEIDNVIFFMPINNHNYFIRKAGLAYPLSNREIQQRVIVFPINLNSNEVMKFYLRIETGKSLPISLSIYSPKEFFKSEESKYLIFGIFYGALIIMAVYNLFLYLSIKDLSYLFYSLFVISVGYYQSNIDGLGIRFLTPNLTSYTQ